MNIFGYTFPLEFILLNAAILIVVLLIISITALSVAAKANRKIKKVLRDGAGNDITGAIVNYYEKCAEIMNNYNEAESRLQEIEREVGCCIKKVGAIRYNAFEDSNARLSYAAAVLDDTDSGFVINGVYSRGQTATYLKPVKNSKSIYELSEEEEEAIKTAILNYERKKQTI